MQRILCCLALLISIPSSAQKIYGTVFNSTGDLLPYASVTIKGTSTGASANNKARFSFPVSPGKYVVVCQHIGFAKVEKTVNLKSADEEITFILSPQNLDMTEVMVKSGVNMISPAL